MSTDGVIACRTGVIARIILRGDIMRRRGSITRTIILGVIIGTETTSIACVPASIGILATRSMHMQISGRAERIGAAPQLPRRQSAMRSYHYRCRRTTLRLSAVQAQKHSLVRAADFSHLFKRGRTCPLFWKTRLRLQGEGAEIAYGDRKWIRRVNLVSTR